MPPVDRRNPTRAKASDSTCSVMEFLRAYPDDEACLRHVWRERFAPAGDDRAFCERCEGERVFKRYETAQRRPCWFCQTCGHRIHPLVGTIFEGSSTSLNLWFYAMYLITSTRCGISAKHLERELGVTYKTAWRMFNKIRNHLMTQDETPLAGPVEADETWMGGRLRQAERRAAIAAGRGLRGPYVKPRPIVFGAVERGGRVRATVIPDSRAATVQGKIREYVLPESLIYTDDYQGYVRLSEKGYAHRRIRHTAKVYVEGDVHTQTVDGFFALMKNGIKATHHGVSARWLQGYVNEYVWRYNRRDNGRAMFHDLLTQATPRA